MKYDVVFLSYNEPNANENFKRLLEVVKHGGISRVRNIDGIPQAHLKAAKNVGTDWFYVVDADNWILDFEFDFEPVDVSPKSTFVWHAKNASNGLEYGYGGIKLFNRRELLKRLETYEIRDDMTTTLFDDLYVMEEVASETRFATSPFTAWCGAFRECVKLAAKDDQESVDRLKTWTTVATGDFSEEVLRGANLGANITLIDITLINDYNWLKGLFNERKI